MFNRTTRNVTDLEAQAAALTGSTTEFARQAADQAADLAFDAKKARKYAELSAEFAEHQRELQKLSSRLDRLQKTSRGGGFPWTLLLLLGGAYALYRSNEKVRTQASGLLSRIMPNQGGEQVQETQPQGSPQMDTPTVNADMTPGASGNEAYGMGSSPTGTHLGGTAPTPDLGNSSTSTNLNSQDDKRNS